MDFYVNSALDTMWNWTIPLPFSTAWNPKRTPVRQSPSLSSFFLTTFHQLGGAHYRDQPEITLAGHTFTFSNGEWALKDRSQIQKRSPGADPQRRVARLRRQNRALREENGELKLRVELLMDMLTESAVASASSAAAQLQGTEWAKRAQLQGTEWAKRAQLQAALAEAQRRARRQDADRPGFSVGSAAKGSLFGAPGNGVTWD